MLPSHFRGFLPQRLSDLCLLWLLCAAAFRRLRFTPSSALRIRLNPPPPPCVRLLTRVCLPYSRAQMEVTVEFLLDLDRLVQLLESPVFTCMWVSTFLWACFS